MNTVHRIICPLLIQKKKNNKKMLFGLVIEFPCGIHFKYTKMTQANDLTDSSTFHK